MKPFKIEIPETVLEDLKRRLDLTRWPDQVEDNWDDGTNLKYLQELCQYWRKEYDWRRAEAELNQLSHFTTEIDDHNVHFIHEKSKEAHAFPLIISHGWPGSVYEFHKIIEPLTNPVQFGGKAEDAFDVVCPSIPGFGFSEAPKSRGFDVKRMAEIFKKLMNQLNYSQYGAQGGDWGSPISAWLGALDPEKVCGIHITLVSHRSSANAPALTPQEENTQKAQVAFLKGEMGYREIQSTKPQTLGYGLNDSPVGLAAWIVEKFRTWTDCEGDIESIFSKDELLTNIMIYWVTGSITSSTRIYYETRKSKNFTPDYVIVPTGCALFPKELFIPPRSRAEQLYNLQQWTPMPAGGHFAALEQPELLVDDIRTFFRNLRI